MAATRIGAIWRRSRLGSAAFLLLGLVLAAGLFRLFSAQATSAATPKPRAPVGDQFEQLKRDKFEIVCREEGELRPVQVTALTFLRSGKISFLVPEGSYVKKGDKVVGLDTKDIDDEIKQIQEDLATAERNAAQLQQSSDLAIDQLNSDLLTEKDSAALAVLKVDDILSHPYVTEKDDAQNALDSAATLLSSAKADLESDVILASFGFSKRADLESKQVAVAKAEVELERAKIKQKVVLEGSLPYDRQKTVLEREQAELELKLKEIDLADQTDSLKAKVTTARHTVAHAERKLERRRRELERSTLTAPNDGFVVYRALEWLGNRKIEVGERVWASMTPIELPNYEKMKVVTQVPESFIRTLKVRAENVPGTGSKARVKINTLPNHIYNAEVTRIDGWARDRNEKLTDADVKAQGLSGVRVFAVEVELDESDTQRLKDGFRATVEFPVDHLDDVISIPFRAIRNHDGAPSVQVSHEGELEWRAIKPGTRSIDRVEVVSGLTEGETIVVPEVPQVTEESKLKLSKPVSDQPVKSGRKNDDGAPKRDRKEMSGGANH